MPVARPNKRLGNALLAHPACGRRPKHPCLPEQLKPLLTAVVGKVPEKMTREEFAKIYEELRTRMPKKPADGEKKPADGEKKPEAKPEPAKPAG